LPVLRVYGSGSANVAPIRDIQPARYRNRTATVIAGRGQDLIRPNGLGRVDGFDQDEGGGESKEGTEVPGGLLAPQCDAAEAFELSDGLFDAGLPALSDIPHLTHCL
jgi:hypothetical protein